MSVDSSLFAFAYDVEDEGADTVVGNVADRAGARGVTMAVIYHDGRDVFPHGRNGHVRYLEPGSTFFSPDPASYVDSPIKPRRSAITGDRDQLAELLRAAGRRGLDVHAWTVFLHHDRIGEHLDYAPRNAFGDLIKTDLCASNPGARAWARSLASDVAQRGVKSILAEAVQFFPLEHGVHHERYFLPLGPRTRFLMGLCFCPSCREEAKRDGIDAGALGDWAKTQIEAAFRGELDDLAGELTQAEVRAMADGVMAGYLGMRERIVATLTSELRDVAAQNGVRLTFLDPSGATKGYATGKPTGSPSPTIAWQIGVDLLRTADAADDVEVLGYAADVGWIKSDLEAYRLALGGSVELVVALRPGAPDSSSADDLRSKVQAAVAAGVRRVDFYHYGLTRLDALDRIRHALHG